MFTKAIAKTLNTAEKEITAASEAIKKANADYAMGRISSNSLSKATEDGKSAGREAVANAHKAIDAALTAYLASLPTRYQLNGETVDAGTLALLENRFVSLKAVDVESMFEKHKGNLGMQRVISEYEAEKQTGANIVFHQMSEREAAAIDYASACKGAVSAYANTGNSIAFALYACNKGIPACLIGE